MNVLCGISGHGGKYACAFCEGESDLSCGKMRTLGTLKARYKEFVEGGSDKKKMMDAKNVINPPIIEGDDCDLVLDKIPPPELHLMMGAANKIWDLLSSLWGEGADKWARSKGITKHGYNGGGLDGVNSDLLLKLADQLVTICPLELQPMVVALQKLQLLVAGCFSHTVVDDIKEKFSNFIESLKSLLDFQDFSGTLFFKKKSSCNFVSN